MAEIKQIENTQPPTSKRKNQPSLIQIPIGKNFPHSLFTNALWIKLTPKPYQEGRSGGRGGSLTLGRSGTTFKFLAPPTILESHNHEWKEYATLQSRLLGLMKSVGTGTHEFGQIAENLMTEFKNKGVGMGKQIGQILQNRTATGINIPQKKIDTPLAYTSSQRRMMNLTFVLANADKATPDYVVDTVHRIQAYAAPVANDNISIDFPHIWKVELEPAGLFKMEYVAMTSVQPQWKEPYIHGNPQVCELTLSFTDMSPLFKSTIETGSIITVNGFKPKERQEFRGDLERIKKKKDFHIG